MNEYRFDPVTAERFMHKLARAHPTLSRIQPVKTPGREGRYITLIIGPTMETFFLGKNGEGDFVIEPTL